MAAHLVLDWGKWPADVLTTHDDGQTWEGDVLPRQLGRCAGFAHLERVRCSQMPAWPVVGIYIIPIGFGLKNSEARLEEIHLQTGGAWNAASGSCGTWSIRRQALTLIRHTRGRGDVEEIAQSTDGGNTFFGIGLAVGLCMARRSGRTGENLESSLPLEAGRPALGGDRSAAIAAPSCERCRESCDAIWEWAN